MKYIFTLALSLFSGIVAAQWTTLTTPATDHLNDVDFIDKDYGVITGNSGTILLTTNGGLAWTDISSNISSYDIYGVKVFNADTIIVSTFDINTADGIIFMTVNGGTSWVQIGADAGINHKIDLESNTINNLWSLGGNLVSTSDFGSNWDTLISNTAGTSSMDVIAFASPAVGHVSGLVSGFSTYSAIFSRTENGGASWFPGDVFSFPNADAFTAMCFTDPDTAMYFMNQYAGFMPSAINKLIKIYGFNKVSPFPGDTIYSFSSQNINTSMPAYINDAYFIDAMNGLALGDDGNVYVTDDGGVTWNIDYSTGVALKKLEVHDTTVYAVGNNGTVIKYGSVTGIQKHAELQFTVYPNPFTDVFKIKADDYKYFNVKMYTAEGKLITGFSFHGQYDFPAAELTSGLYTLELQDEQGNSYHIKLMKL